MKSALLDTNPHGKKGKKKAGSDGLTRESKKAYKARVGKGNKPSKSSKPPGKLKQWLTEQKAKRQAKQGKIGKEGHLKDFNPDVPGKQLERNQNVWEKRGSVVRKTNSWEEHDVKMGRKQMREGHKGHAEALFDDAHGSWNWSKSHHSTGAEHNHVVNRIAGRNSR